MAVRDHSWHHARAQRLLGDIGVQIAGTEVTLFVVRLLHGLEAGLDDDANVAAAGRTVSDGPIGLVHGEPALAWITLDPRPATVQEAAELAVRAFAQTVLDRQRRDPIVPSPPPTEQQRAAMRARFDDERPARIEAALAALTSTRWTERANAASLLGRYAVLEARPAIEALLDDQYPEVVRAATDALRDLPAAGDPPA